MLVHGLDSGDDPIASAVRNRDHRQRAREGNARHNARRLSSGPRADQMQPPPAAPLSANPFDHTGRRQKLIDPAPVSLSLLDAELRGGRDAGLEAAEAEAASAAMPADIAAAAEERLWPEEEKQVLRAIPLSGHGSESEQQRGGDADAEASPSPARMQAAAAVDASAVLSSHAAFVPSVSSSSSSWSVVLVTPTAYDAPLPEDDGGPERPLHISRQSSGQSIDSFTSASSTTQPSSQQQQQQQRPRLPSAAAAASSSSSSPLAQSESELLALLAVRSATLSARQLHSLIEQVQQMEDDDDADTETEAEAENTNEQHEGHKSGSDRMDGDAAAAAAASRRRRPDHERDSWGEDHSSAAGAASLPEAKQERSGRSRKKKHRGGRRRPTAAASSAAQPPADGTAASAASSAAAATRAASNGLPGIVPVSPSPAASASSSSASFVSDLPPPSSAHRDWNEEFQQLLSRVADDETVLDQQEAFEKLSELAADFAFTARCLGRIIISEKYLAADEKTIRPVLLGGVAGGEKYVSHNIVFKFNVDHLGLYGGDAAAMAAGNHELSGLSAFYRVISTLRGVGIHVPLACLIDYRGFRLWATSRLPITRRTLILGSNDQGQHIVNQDPDVSSDMRRIAFALNLKPHYVRDASGKETLLFGPFDIEVHRGTDGRVYLLDFHRCFPPEPAYASSHLHLKNPHLYRMLRPELVMSNEVPLSSDAYVERAEVRADGARVAVEEVSAAYQRLITRVIPNFAALLESLGGLEQLDSINVINQRSVERSLLSAALANHKAAQPDDPDASSDDQVAAAVAAAYPSSAMAGISRAPSPAPSPPSPGGGRATYEPASSSAVDPIVYIPRFLTYLHQAGINIRYLGLLRAHLRTQGMRDMLLVEMLARVLKADMRRRWRERMSTVRYISDVAYRRCSIDFCNLVFFNSQDSRQHWQTEIKRQLTHKFQNALGKEELEPSFDLKASLLPMAEERQPPSTRSDALLLDSPANVPPTLTASSTAAAPLHALPPAHQRRLSLLLQTAIDDSCASPTVPSSASAAAAPPMAHRVPPLSPALMSPRIPPRLDLLRLVFLRFIHTTGIVLQMSIIPQPELIYNQLPAPPMPQTRQQQQQQQQHGKKSGSVDAPDSPSLGAAASPQLSAVQSQPLPLRPGQSAPRRASDNAQNLPTIPNHRAQSGTAQLPSLHRSTSSSLLYNHAHQQQFFPPTPAAACSDSPTPAAAAATLPSSSSPAPLSSSASSFWFYERPMEDIHLLSVEEQLTTLNIVSYAEGTALLCKCVSKSRHEDGSAAGDQQNIALTNYLASLAEAKFREALRRNKSDGLSLCNYSMLVSLVYKDKEQAKKLLMLALHANPSHHRSLYYLGQLYQYELHQPLVADFLYRRALTLNPQHVNSHKDFGNLLQHAPFNDLRASQEHYQTAVRLQPSHIKAQLQLGQCLALKAQQWSDFDAVVACYREAARSNYGERAARLNAQRKYLVLLTVKGELHAERKEPDRARLCFEEVLSYRPPALLPYQARADPSAASYSPPAAAMLVYAQLECRQGDHHAAQYRFLKAVEAATGLPVSVERNDIQLPAYAQAAAAALFSPLVLGAAVAPSPSSAGLSTVAAQSAFTLPSSAVWAQSSPPSSSSAAPTSSLTLALRAKTAAGAAEAVLSPDAGPASSPSRSPSPPAAEPASAASTAAPAPSSRAGGVPWSVVLSSSPPTPLSNAWQQQKHWKPDRQPTVPATAAVHSKAMQKQQQQQQPGRKLSNSASTASCQQPRPAASSQPAGAAPRVDAAGVSSPQSAASSAIPILPPPPPALLADAAVEEEKEEEKEAASLTSAAVACNVASSEQTAAAALANGEPERPTLSPAAIATESSRNKDRELQASLSQAEKAEREDEERKERDCCGTTAVRLYADYLSRYSDDAQLVERWHRAAVLLCPYGRSGSLNLACLADFLGRTKRLQAEALTLFNRAVSSSTPTAEAMLRYAAYCADVLDDRTKADRLREQAALLKRAPPIGHRCQRTSLGWHCEGDCDFPVLRAMVAVANRRPQRQTQRGVSDQRVPPPRQSGLQQQQQQQQWQPAVAKTAAPLPSMLPARVASLPVSVPTSSSASQPPATAPVTAGYEGIASPSATLMSSSRTSSWSKVASHHMTQQQPPAASSTLFPTSSLPSSSAVSSMTVLPPFKSPSSVSPSASSSSPAARLSSTRLPQPSSSYSSSASSGPHPLPTPLPLPPSVPAHSHYNGVVKRHAGPG